MTKAELIERLAARTQLPRRDAARAVDGTLRLIEEELRDGGEVAFAGFGRFHVGLRGGRDGVNPRTGEPMRIPTTRVPRFTAGAVLKRAVRG